MITVLAVLLLALVVRRLGRGHRNTWWARLEARRTAGRAARLYSTPTSTPYGRFSSC